jgi:hypothetical protein
MCRSEDQAEGNRTMTSAGSTIRRWFEKPDRALLDEHVEWAVPGYSVPHDTYVGRDAVMDDFFPALRANFAE